jgi:hypothetical protein
VSLSKLKQLAKKLPKGLHSDWDGTNHYELTAQGKEYFWLMVGDGLGDSGCETVVGKRFGLLMDIAEEVGRLKDAGEL